MMLISDFTTLSFDCYGTLIDWETGIHEALQPLVRKSAKAMDRDSVLGLYAECESAIQSEYPDVQYGELLETKHRRIAERLNVSVPDVYHRDFASSIRNWPPFADSVTSLKYLKKHFKLVVLSNVDNAGFGYSNQHLEVEFDAIFTAQDIGSYKPDLKNFDYMLSELQKAGTEKSEILHTAQSQFHDMAPATARGLKTCWIDRRANQAGSGATPRTDKPVVPDFYFVTLAQMAAAHKQECRQA